MLRGDARREEALDGVRFEIGCVAVSPADVLQWVQASLLERQGRGCEGQRAVNRAVAPARLRELPEVWADEPLEPRSSKGEGGKLGHEFEPPSSSGHLKVCIRLVAMSNLALAFGEPRSRVPAGKRGEAVPESWKHQPRGGERVSYLRLRLAIVVGALLALAGSTSGLAASDGVVISQVYGAGGNAGASYNADFIELFNRGTTPVVLDGMSVQYASATGTGNLGANAGQLTELSGTIQPGKYLLIHESSGATGAPLPANRHRRSDADRDGGRSRARSHWRPERPRSAATPPPPAPRPARSDASSTSSATETRTSSRGRPQLRPSTATSSAVRAGSGCTETDDNAADFAALSPPAPRNSATTAFVCGGAHSDRSDRRRFGHSGFGPRRREHAPHRRGHAGCEPDEHRHQRHR